MAWGIDVERGSYLKLAGGRVCGPLSWVDLCCLPCQFTGGVTDYFALGIVTGFARTPVPGRVGRETDTRVLRAVSPPRVAFYALRNHTL